MKPNDYLETRSLPDFTLWDKMMHSRNVIGFHLELTARCNNDCRHCYINLPADDREALRRELTLDQIKKIVDEAAEMGSVWCLLTGGEPLLRKDFCDIYMHLKKKGMMVSVLTNATLISQKHITLFKQYPPRDIEVTVYGVTEQTYERISGKKGSFAAFEAGINLLLENGIKVRFKTMALRANFDELAQIAVFCRARTKDYFRFDPGLHLRYDGNKLRNELIKAERLTPEQVVALEQGDSERRMALENNCDKLIRTDAGHVHCHHLFHCGAGLGNFIVSYEGFFRLCSSLWHPECIYDLKKGSVSEAWRELVPKVRAMRSDREEFLQRCRACSLINLCLWCPAHAHLETGVLDQPVEYFCDVAHARAESLGHGSKGA